MIRKGKLKRCMGVILAVSMVATNLFGGGLELSAMEQSLDHETEWQEVSSLLDEYKGIYLEPSKISNLTKYAPDGPLMGNGTVLAFMGGDRNIQNIYISRTDMWQDRSTKNGQEYTALGGITIQKEEEKGENLALNRPITVSSWHDEEGTMWDWPGECLIDGKLKTKWCSTKAENNNLDQYWAVIDLGQEQDISRWVVKHAQAGGESAGMNTRNFKLQYSIKENPEPEIEQDWIDIDSVVDNTGAITDRNFSTVKTRYIRLVVTKAEQGNGTTVRICELELYNKPKDDMVNATFSYEQDMKNAEVTAQSEKGFKTRTWLSAKENIIVTEIENLTNSPLNMETLIWTANQHISSGIDEENGLVYASKSGVSVPRPDRLSGADGATWPGFEVNVTIAGKVLGTEANLVAVNEANRSIGKTSFELQPQEKVTLVTAVEGGKDSSTHLEEAKGKVISRNTKESLIKANELHREWWKNYWLKSYIDIQDEKVERMYYGMLYELGCATSTSSENNAGLAAGLFPWTANEHPAWQGDYTTNTDMPRQIHPLIQANRLEGLPNYFNIMEQYWPEGQRRAESPQHLNWVISGTGRPNLFREGIKGGVLFPTHIGPWGASTEQYNGPNDYFLSPADASSMIMPMVKYWQYTQDEGYLETILYPMLKSVAIFWENYVTMENGKYVVYGATHEGWGGRNPIFDLGACKYILTNAIDAAKELGIDQEKQSIWTDIIEKLSPVPTMQYNGKEVICDVEGRSQQNPGRTFDGNPVTIQSVYYYDTVGMSASEEEKEKYINYLNVKNGEGSARRLMSATRLGYDLNEIMSSLRSAAIDPSPSDWSGLRNNNTIGDIGAASLLGVVQDSLLQSNEGFLNIFVNWFDDQPAKIKRMRARGAFLVDAEQNQFGQVTYLNILSEKGKDCSVLNPWAENKLEVYEDGQLIETTIDSNLLGEVYTFKTQLGSHYELKPMGGLPSIIKLDKYVATVLKGDTLKLMATTYPEEKEVKWHSSNPEVAVIGEDGTITALKAGEVDIVATIVDGIGSATCKVTVIESNNNVAIGKMTTDSGQHDNFSPDRAVNGNWYPSYSGWVSAEESWDDVNNRWLEIDLGKEYSIERWVLRHDGHRSQNTDDPIGNPQDASNWGDYYLQVKGEENNWITIDSKIDNKNNTTDRILDQPITGRYFRIYMEFPMFKSSTGWKWKSGFARINQLELYQADDNQSIEVVEVQALEDKIVEKGSSFEELMLPTKLNVLLSNGASAMIDVEWRDEIYNGEIGGEYEITGILDLPSSIHNPNGLEAKINVIVKGELTAENVADTLEIEQPLPNSTQLKLPEVAAGFSVAITTSSCITVIDLNGKITPPEEDTEVTLTFTVTQESNQGTATKEIVVIVPAKLLNFDKNDLEKMIKEAESILPDQELYTKQSFKEFEKALKYAKKVLDREKATQEEINNAMQNLIFRQGELQIKPAEPPIVGIEEIILDQTSAILKEGESLQLKVTIVPDNAANTNIVWSSEDDSIAKVNPNGKIIAKNAGITKIIATTEEGNKTASCIITVIEKKESK